jgi:plastocyanin
VPSLPKAAFIPAVLVTAGLAIAAVVAAATSGDDSSAATSPPSTAVASASTEAPAAPAGEAAAATIADFAFDPDPVSVKVGQSVTWTNADPFAHSVKAGDGSFDSGSLAKGQAFTTTFSAPGSYSYLCGIHNSMTGTVVVEP